MPVFHTKTIEGILEPVAQQVSRLVILHEEAEDGNAMPDLERPVMAVSCAVTNLVKVGKETINSSDDPILKQDMPAALYRVEGASKLLEEASGMLKVDPYSGPARKKLIEGSRGILQGTSSLLLCFDESEVRKIIRECKKVLDYLAVAEVIETMEDLVQFLKDLSPCLSKVSREVGAREKELTHQVHREILIRCLDQVKTLAPILICSMKIFIHIISSGGKGAEEAAENRNYLTSRMTDELHEIIRVLQLTTYDEDEWDADNLTVMKKAQNAIQSKIRNAKDWLEDPLALRGGVGEKSVRQILEHAQAVADRALPSDRDTIHKLCGDVNTMTEALCELRQTNKGTTPQAESLARGIQEKLGEVCRAVSNAINNMDKHGGGQIAHTVSGRLEQAQRWLSRPQHDDHGLGQQAIALIVSEGKKVADGLPGVQRSEILTLCDQVDRLSRQLSDLCRRGQGNSPQAQEIARTLSQKLHELKEKIQNAVVNRVVEDFVDIVTPLKHFTEAVHVPEGTPGRDVNFNDKAAALNEWSTRAARTGRMVAAGGSGGNKKLAESLVSAASQVESLTPQLVNAGRIRLNYNESKAADEHFDNLRAQYSDSVARIRNLCDEATDSAHFIKISEEHMQKHTVMCEDAIARHEPQKYVEQTTCIARLGNRVLQVAKQEADNSEDPEFISAVNRAADNLQSSITHMVQDAKAVAMNTHNSAAVSKWRESNRALLNSVGQVRRAVTVMPDINNLHINEVAPPRPPLPGGEVPPPRPPPPAETDDEDDMFMHAPLPNQPIMMAAHGLHQEVRQWSSKDNDIIAAAKKMALLMGRLSQLVRGEGGTKRDLIACAKAIAEASEEVTRLAKELARECTDKRMRTNLLQVCERIPTIGTQLKILSTVKATMLGAQGTEEDQEATDMLVGNAQNLMQSVKETVRAAESASIKIRTDAGIRLRWVRRQPWYQY
ncbi:vinculin-like isoform X9 [Macrosteles quadrilineatus]|uniref:vinculin-like isoform X8 n=1 Tax=Macrosteles quadrilineatus TaxID=74068 RepID=UPI0023E100F3|nr:vinculin-like isoform X8 [Macrosteles quadrilineatus]XP_054275174.1 vinculin-like isoform X9 [Macrosteles quadrilineatus]